MGDTPVTGSELDRLLKLLERQHEATIAHIDTRIDALAQQLAATDERITTRQDTANGRTTKNEAMIQRILEGGCAKSAEHIAAVDALMATGVLERAQSAVSTSAAVKAAGWRPTPKQVGLGISGVGGLALAYKILEVLQAWIGHLQTVTK